MTEIVLPELGENITEGTVIRLVARPGEALVKDQTVLEVETGKASVEVPSPVSGSLAEWLVQDGDTVAVGQPIFRVEASDADPKTKPAEKASPEPAAPAPEPSPAASQPAPTPEPQPIDVPSEPVEPAPEAPVAPVAEPASGSRVSVAASPTVRTLAREIGVPIRDVTGTGPDGRITPEDVKGYARSMLSSGGASVPSMSATPLPDFARWGAIEREPLTAIRRATAEHMARCWAEIPHVTQHDTADCTQLEAARKRLMPAVEASGGRLTLTVILLKFLAEALHAFPTFNASLDLAGGAVIFKRYVHIAVAVDTPRGLLAPVLRDVDTKGLRALAAELAAVSGKAREGKLSPDEMNGGTFTLTNLGGIGGGFFTPIVNAPQVAILGVGRACKESAGDGPSRAERLKLPLSLSYDHRLIDGADGARFLQWLKASIEEPLAAWLDG